MRITQKEVDIIKENILAIDPEAGIFLFGSRVNDALKGGDIDIFLEASKNIQYKDRLLLEHRISSECDIKVDIVVKLPGNKDEIIHQIARMGSKL